MEKIKVGIVGAGGYGGCGAIEILSCHPHAEIKLLVAVHNVGTSISELYPHLTGFCDLSIMAPDDQNLPDDLDIIFFATPDGVGQKDAGKWLEKGVKVVDYSGDFRFNDTETYKGYAARIGIKGPHLSPELLPESVYGLPELHREEIVQKNLVGNPGCFAASCILGLSPAVKFGLIDPDSIICDAKTGVSGAGKTPSPSFHYPARYDAMNAYKISGHQHVFEIERELSVLSGKKITITFTPHVVPVCRGIMSTIYAQLEERQDLDTVKDAYRSFYSKDAFVRIFGPEKAVVSTDVRGSNFCNISVNTDTRTGKLIIVSFIDNLMKGQAGNAVQNMNIMFGLDETEGLADRPAMYP